MYGSHTIHIHEKEIQTFYGHWNNSTRIQNADWDCEKPPWDLLSHHLSKMNAEERFCSFKPKTRPYIVVGFTFPITSWGQDVMDLSPQQQRLITIDQFLLFVSSTFMALIPKYGQHGWDLREFCRILSPINLTIKHKVCSIRQSESHKKITTSRWPGLVCLVIHPNNYWRKPSK